MTSNNPTEVTAAGASAAAVVAVAAPAAAAAPQRAAAAPRLGRGRTVAAPRPRHSCGDPYKKSNWPADPPKQEIGSKIWRFAIFARFLKSDAETDINIEFYTKKLRI